MASNDTSSISSTDNTIAGTVLVLEGLSGIVIYSLVLFVLIKRKFYKDHPAYYIIISNGILETFLLLFFVFMGVSVLTQSYLVPQNLLFLHTFLLNIPWTGNVLHIALLALQRFAAVFGAVRFQVLQIVFTAKFCKIAVAVSWFSGALYYTVTYLLFPELVASYFNYQLWVLLPVYPKYNDAGALYWLVFNFSFPIFSVLINLPTAINAVLKKRKLNKVPANSPELRTLAKERTLVYMSALHAFVLLLTNIFLNELSHKASDKWVRLILCGSFGLNFYVPPLIYLCVNKSLRLALKNSVTAMTNSTVTEVLPLK